MPRQSCGAEEGGTPVQDHATPLAARNSLAGAPGPLQHSGTLRRIVQQASLVARAKTQDQDPSTPGSRTKLSKAEKIKAMNILGRSYLKSWLGAHGQQLRPPKLHDSVRRVIGAWFDMVDEDGSGGLDHSELAAALKAAGLPCDEQSILEMIRLMDVDRDGTISWVEFEAFLTNEFAAGKALLSGEYVLPSGTALPFGAMVAKMRRDRLMADILQGGEKRDRWCDLAADERKLKAELNMLSIAQQEQQTYRRHAMLKSYLQREEEGALPATTLVTDEECPPDSFPDGCPTACLSPSSPEPKDQLGLRHSSHCNVFSHMKQHIADSEHDDRASPCTQVSSEQSPRQPCAVWPMTQQATRDSGGGRNIPSQECVAAMGSDPPGHLLQPPKAVEDYRAALGAANHRATRVLCALVGPRPQGMPVSADGPTVAEGDGSDGAWQVGRASQGMQPGEPAGGVLPPPRKSNGLASQSGLTAAIMQRSIAHSLNLKPSNCLGPSGLLARVNQPRLPIPASEHKLLSLPAAAPSAASQAARCSSPATEHPLQSDPKPEPARTAAAVATIRDVGLEGLFAAVAADNQRQTSMRRPHWNSDCDPRSLYSPFTGSGATSSSSTAPSTTSQPSVSRPDPSAPPSVVPATIQHPCDLQTQAHRTPVDGPRPPPLRRVPSSRSYDNLTVHLLTQHMASAELGHPGGNHIHCAKVERAASSCDVLVSCNITQRAAGKQGVVRLEPMDLGGRLSSGATAKSTADAGEGAMQPVLPVKLPALPVRSAAASHPLLQDQHKHQNTAACSRTRKHGKAPAQGLSALLHAGIPEIRSLAGVFGIVRKYGSQ